VVVEFRREVAAPALPAWLTIPLLRAVAALGRLRCAPKQATAHE